MGAIIPCWEEAPILRLLQALFRVVEDDRFALKRDNELSGEIPSCEGCSYDLGEFFLLFRQWLQLYQHRFSRK